MAIENRKSKSLIMKIITKKVRRLFSGIMGGDSSYESMKSSREKIDQIESKRRRRKGTVMRKKTLGGVPVEVTAGVGCKTDNIILYLHGGAFTLGIFSQQRRYAEALALFAGCPVIMADYALAPEYPFPAGLDDCEKIYAHLRKNHRGSRIIVAGDSAGGTFALALTLRLKAKGEELPDRLVLHSPSIDLSGKLDHSINESINDDVIVTKELGPFLAEAYIRDADPTDYEVSPCYGDLTGFPPTFITTELHETLYADSLELDKMLDEAGVPVKTIVMDGGFHTYALLADVTPETKKILKETIEFIKE